MEYLGEFLSPQNSIAQDQDTLIKYFYFRPELYEDPNADLENIFIIKEMAQFPKRYDLLSENPLYAVDTIEVSKRVSDEEPGVKKVSYVVTANYDLLENIRKKESSGGGGGGGDDTEEDTTNVTVDINGEKVTKSTPPWNYKGTWSSNALEKKVPFISGYNEFNSLTVPVINTAGQLLTSETKKFQLELTYTKSFESANSVLDNLMNCATNNNEFDLYHDARPAFPSGTLLVYPPNCNLQYWEHDVDVSGVVSSVITPYVNYSIKFLYDPDGHDKHLLNMGTFARFDEGIERIYKITIVTPNGDVIQGYPKYVSLSEALRLKVTAENQGNTPSVETVSDPVPLTNNGEIDLSKLSNPTSSLSWPIISFKQYPSMNFQTLPIHN